MSERKILIIDDDSDIRLGLNVRLRASGYTTAFAADGVSAIRMARKERPCLILLDLGLPPGTASRCSSGSRSTPSSPTFP